MENLFALNHFCLRSKYKVLRMLLCQALGTETVVSVYRVLGLSGPRLRLLLLQFAMSRGQCMLFQYAAADIVVLTVCTESAGTLQCNVLRLILGFYSVCLKKLLKMFSFVSHLRVTPKQTRCSLPVEFLLVKLKTLHPDRFFPIILNARIISVYFILYIAPQRTTTRVQIWRTRRPHAPFLLCHKKILKITHSSVGGVQKLVAECV